ncbi:MAG TPA: DUF1573 domain-containing protein [Lutibacter sp.]|nr:DUF1573 domain-containing protein [Lutibacter sp.]
MKKIVTILVLLLFVVSVQAQQNKKKGATSKAKVEKEFDPNGPIIKFESQTVNYGRIDKGSDGTREFKFTNVGKSPLKITKVKSSCGCTIPTYPKTQIMPGESDIIKVKYNTKKVGKFSKSVSIFTNTVPERNVLRIKGTVIDPNKPGPIRKEKNMLEF